MNVTYIFNRNNYKWSSASRFCDDSKIFWIYGAVVTIGGILTHDYRLIAFFFPEWLAIDVPVFGVPDFEAWHVLQWRVKRVKSSYCYIKLMKDIAKDNIKVNKTISYQVKFLEHCNMNWWSSYVTWPLS